MNYLEKHKRACAELYVGIQSYLSTSGVPETTFCREAGAHVAAVKKLRDGSATPSTVAVLEAHLWAVITKAKNQCEAS